jgi:predicted phage baseplate assembly protein
LIDIQDLPVVQGPFTIEIAPLAGGIARAPRVSRIEPNVLPVLQNEDITSELHELTGVVGQVIVLDTPGLRYGGHAPAVEVLVLEAGNYVHWRLETDLANANPEDPVYTLDRDRREIRFGNGVNGRLPPAGNLLVNYSACDGAAGNLPRNQSWLCRGIADIFGKNLDATGGGADALDLAGMRRQARERLHEGHALVTSADLIEAALSLPLLDIVRAHVVEKDPNLPRMPALPGTRTLVLLRSRATASFSADEMYESPRWLAAAQRLLSVRLPMGERLRVIAPNYVHFHVVARLRLERMASPSAVMKAAKQELANRLSLVPADGRSVWPFGREVAAVQVAAWFSKVEGVAKVETYGLYLGDDSNASEIIKITGNDLPLLDLDRTHIAVVRAGRGA